MRTAEECIRQAEALEKLAEKEPEEFRRRAYLQMADYWRESARIRSGELKPPPFPER